MPLRQPLLPRQHCSQVCTSCHWPIVIATDAVSHNGCLSDYLEKLVRIIKVGDLSFEMLRKN